MSINHPNLVEINIDAFSANLREISRWIGPGKKIFPIIKADAYGHGALILSKEAVSKGYNTFGVGNLNEAIGLRKSGIKSDILVLCGCYSGHEELFIDNRLQPVVYSHDSIIRFKKSVEKTGKEVYIHLKIDTGMGRLGFLIDEIEDVIKEIMTIPKIIINGILTHFSSAFLEEREITLAQLNKFIEVIKSLRGNGIPVPLIHAANSAGILFFRDAYFDGVRPGIILYGVSPSKHLPLGYRLEPVMRFKTRIIQLKRLDAGKPVSYGETFITMRDSILATIPVGYADGYLRNLSNKAYVLVRGCKVPQVGTICMDMCVIDVTDVPDVKVGDEVVLFGRQGDKIIHVEEVAEWGETIPYEILCQVGNRVKREYIKTA